MLVGQSLQQGTVKRQEANVKAVEGNGSEAGPRRI
jgi:hypothetical protein